MLLKKSENYYHWSPKAGISYRINNIFKLRTNLGQGFKTPSPDQLSAEYEYDAGYGPTRILGNPDLKPETSIAYDAGFDLTPENINFGFTYSYTKTKDLIVQAAEIVEYNGENWTTFENSGKTRMQAIDTNFHILMGKMLKLPVGIELITNFTKNLEYVDRDNDDEKLNYISNYECRSNLRLSYKMVVINLSYIYIGKQNFQNWDNLDANYNPTIEEKDSFYFFNLNLRILIGKYLELTGSVDNLTNKDYEWVQGYPMPERNYKLGVVGKF